MNAPWVEQAWVEHLGWTLIHFLWQGALIAAIYAIARRLSRPSQAPCQAPQSRYLLACVALIAMIAEPIVTFVLIGATAPAHTAHVTAPVPHVPVQAPSAPAPLSIYISEPGTKT